MTYIFEKIYDDKITLGIVDIFQKIKANDRRKMANAVFNNWFSDNHMKLGQDYRIDFVSATPSGANAHWGRMMAIVTMTDPAKAVLFKLANGGNV